MKKILLLFIFITVFCSEDKKESIYIVLEANKEVEFKLNKNGKIHEYKCELQKGVSSKDSIVFNVCGIIFTSNIVKETKITKITKINKSNILTFSEFFALPNPQRESIDRGLYFLDKTNSNSYMRYSVKWSNDFYEIENSEKTFKKF